MVTTNGANWLKCRHPITGGPGCTGPTPLLLYWRDQLFQWGPRVLFAILILVATHFIAKAVQWGVAKGIDRMPVLKRHPVSGGESVGHELGRLGYWLVWLVGLIAALQPLGLSERAARR